MTTDDLIRHLRAMAGNKFAFEKRVLTEAADRMEEQDRIIQRYKRADVFLATHGWEWRDD